MHRLVLPFFGILLVGCQADNRKTEGLFPEFVTSENQLTEGSFERLTSEVLSVEDRELLSVYDLLILDHKLILCNGVANPEYFSAIDLNDGSFVGRFGIEGSGPGEFTGVLRTTVANRDKHNLGVVSKNSGDRYFEFNLDSALSYDSYRPVNKARFGFFGANRMESTNSGRFAAISLHSHKRLVVLDSTGEIMSEHFPYPFEEEMVGEPKEIYGMAYQSKMVRNEEEDLVAIFNMNTPNWDIVDMSVYPPKLLNQTHLRPIDFLNTSEISETSRSYGVSKSASNKKGFVDVTANSRFIYGLYSGKTYAEHGNDYDFANLVLVFDWSGRLVRKIELQGDTKIIAVDDTDTFLYVLVEKQTRSEIQIYPL